jgi:hypothetical protein
VEKSKYPLYKGGYGRGEGVYPYHHYCHTTLVPEGFTYGCQQVINNTMWISLFVYSNFVLVYSLTLYPQTIRNEYYKN